MKSTVRRTGIRTYSVLLVLAAMVPIAMFAAILILQLWSVQRAQLAQRHQNAVEGLSNTIAQYLNDSIARLQVLASSQLADADNTENFRALARDSFLAHTPEWRHLLMFDAASFEQVFNLSAGAATVLPRVRELPHYRLLLDAHQPVVSDLFIGKTTGQPVVEVAVPVMRGDAVQNVLVAVLSLPQLVRMLDEQVAPAEVAALVDGQRAILARTRDSSAYVGKKVVPQLQDKMQQAPAGWSRFTTFEGDAVYSAWAPVPGFKWSIAYGIPAAPIEQALVSSLAVLTVMGLLLIAGGGWIALRLSHRVAAAINASASAARQVADGQPVALDRTGVIELDALGDSLRDAGQRVAGETAIRAEAEAERNRLLDNERQARVQAQDESRMKDEFLATLGHELRNPLAAIGNAARVLQRAAVNDPTARHAIEIIQRQSLHQSRLLDDLLDVARVNTGKLVLRLAPLDLADSVRAALFALGAERVAQHRVVTSLQSAWISGDSARIEQIIINLVGNALKFTPAGGRISIDTRRDGDVAVLRVQDNGIGIPPHFLPRVFDLFSQDAAGGAVAEGLGIGLTLVRRLADLHGGSATAASDGSGRGATICVQFPAIEPIASAPTDKGCEPKPQSRGIVLVEDNDDVREMMTVLLTMDGHHVTAVGTAKAALDAVDKAQPQVAIVDIDLPDISGNELARTLRAKYGAAICLISLSGFGTLNSGAETFDAQLVKPVDPARLASIIEQACGQP